MNQPNKPSYPIAELYPYHAITREEFKKLAGFEAPAYDPNKPRKRWWDPKAPQDSKKSYNVVEIKDGKPVVGTMFEYGYAVNLPGEVAYSEYKPAPTNAFQNCAATNDEPASSKPVDVNHLSELSEAQAMLQELHGTGIQEENFSGPCSVNWNGETRRFWQIQVNGQWHNVGLLLKLKNAQGVGRPGSWAVSGTSITWNPVFQSDAGLQDPRPEVPFPIRPLFANEQLALKFGGVVVVNRTDLPANYDPNDIPARLTAIEKLLTKIAAALSIAG